MIFGRRAARAQKTGSYYNYTMPQAWASRYLNDINSLYYLICDQKTTPPIKNICVFSSENLYNSSIGSGNKAKAKRTNKK